jgi:hypothetical protein
MHESITAHAYHTSQHFWMKTPKTATDQDKTQSISKMNVCILYYTL